MPETNSNPLPVSPWNQFMRSLPSQESTRLLREAYQQPTLELQQQFLAAKSGVPIELIPTGLVRK